MVASSEDTARKLLELEAKLDRLLKAQGIQDISSEPHALEC